MTRRITTVCDTTEATYAGHVRRGLSSSLVPGDEAVRRMVRGREAMKMK
jgi:hypothetical protein